MPLHPHRPGDPLTNRRPTPVEIAAWLPALCVLIERLQPRRIAAIGRCAQTACRQAGVPAYSVSHPSYGGAQIFKEAFKRFLGSAAFGL